MKNQHYMKVSGNGEVSLLPQMIYADPGDSMKEHLVPFRNQVDLCRLKTEVRANPL